MSEDSSRPTQVIDAREQKSSHNKGLIFYSAVKDSAITFVNIAGLDGINWRTVRRRGTSAFLFTFLTWIIISSARSPLAVYSNNLGDQALRQDNPSNAQTALSYAAMFHPAIATTYMNQGDFAIAIGDLDKAKAKYVQARDTDPNFAPAYRSLGHVYNRQQRFVEAERTLLSGLNRLAVADHSPMAEITRYGLQAELGVAYYGQQRIDEASKTLEAAIALEDELRQLEQAASMQAGEPVVYRYALPHYYLAQIYEQLQRPRDAACAWRESLRFLDDSAWDDREWLVKARQRIQILGPCIR